MPELNNIQFQYGLHETGGKPLHKLVARSGPLDSQVGMMLWSNKEIRSVEVRSEVRRSGVATSLWNEGHRLAEENARIPRPKHSTQRTDDGDAWARKMGGSLPRRDKR